MVKCTEFYQAQRFTSNQAIERLLEDITVQRCYDPFSLVESLSRLTALPLEDQPDIVILMDWAKTVVPFMTNTDLLPYKKYHKSNDEASKEKYG